MASVEDHAALRLGGVKGACRAFVLCVCVGVGGWVSGCWVEVGGGEKIYVRVGHGKSETKCCAELVVFEHDCGGLRG